MPAFYFPTLFTFPAFDSDVCGNANFQIHKRLWQVSIFDLYSLVAQRHPLRLSAELMQTFLQTANLEIMVEAEGFGDAAERADCFRAMIYLHGVAPSISPFASDISLNRYAGINDRSAGFSDKMHVGLRECITHDTARIETWPHELFFRCIQAPDDTLSREVGEGTIAHAAIECERWLKLEARHSVLRAARRSLVKAPLMPDLQSSVLQVWQGIEGLFPSINAEITFRISLFLAELLSPLRDRLETYDRTKKSYADRSRISHGSLKPTNEHQWFRAWLLLRDAMQAVLIRDALPTEEELTHELLTAPKTVSAE